MLLICMRVIAQQPLLQVTQGARPIITNSAAFISALLGDVAMLRCCGAMGWGHWYSGAKQIGSFFRCSPAGLCSNCSNLSSSFVTMSRPRLVLFGDSLTQFGFGEQAGSGYGWISRLSSTYSRRADVLSRGFSGYNTRHALDVLPNVLADCGAGSAGTSSSRVLLYTLWFGANDAALPGTRQHVPVEEYASNIKTIVGMIRDSHKSSGDSAGDGSGDGATPPIILITPPPVYQPWWEEFCKTYGRDKSDRTNDASRKYGLAMKSIGKELACEILDTWELLGGDAPGFEKQLTDGLHLSEEGNKAIYEGLMDLIEDKFPHLAPMTEGEGRYGEVGVPLCEKLWTELC